MKTLNLPNKLILVRFALTIAVIALMLCAPLVPYYETFLGIEQNALTFSAMACFIAAAFTDYLDGKIARSKNQITEFGKLFDPIADKILVNSTLIIFAAIGRIPIWLVLIFIIRDLMVEGLRMAMVNKKVDISADIFGKLKTIFQFIGIVVLFIMFPAPDGATFNCTSTLHYALIPIYLGAIFSIISGVNYYKKNWKKINKDK